MRPRPCIREASLPRWCRCSYKDALRGVFGIQYFRREFEKYTNNILFETTILEWYFFSKTPGNAGNVGHVRH